MCGCCVACPLFVAWGQVCRPAQRRSPFPKESMALSSGQPSSGEDQGTAAGEVWAGLQSFASVSNQSCSFGGPLNRSIQTGLPPSKKILLGSKVFRICLKGAAFLNCIGKLLLKVGVCWSLPHLPQICTEQHVASVDLLLRMHSCRTAGLMCFPDAVLRQDAQNDQPSVCTIGILATPAYPETVMSCSRACPA